ncbi:MAG: ATP-binding cassette domain-containing protein [Bacteroidota bacterium]
MVEIKLNNIGKRYNHEWIFRNVNETLTSNEAYVFMGGNGSGKSTLLQLVGSNFMCSEGTIDYSIADKKIETEQIFKHVSYATPYLELTEDFTINEILEFHIQFKPLLTGINLQNFIDITEFNKVQNKPIKYFSSGMKQRLKLGLAVLSNSEIVLLDEPVSNLDKKAIDWYNQLVLNYKNNRLFIVCSNQVKDEYNFCTKELFIENYKPQTEKL